MSEFNVRGSNVVDQRRGIKVQEVRRYLKNVVNRLYSLLLRKVILLVFKTNDVIWEFQLRSRVLNECFF